MTCGHVAHARSDDGDHIGYVIGADWESCPGEDAPAPPPSVHAEGLTDVPGVVGRAGAQRGSERRGHQVYDYAVVEVIRVVDGDTIDLRVETDWHDDGFHVEVKTRTAHRFRLLGVDTPERRDLERWRAANEFTRQWLQGRSLRVRTEKGDAFGRWLADVYDPGTHDSLSAALLRTGHAVEYRA